MKIQPSKKTGMAAKLLASSIALGLSAPAAATFTFDVGDWSGVWTTTVSVGTSIRAQDRHKDLYGAPNAILIGIEPGNAGNVVDEGNLNYDKGDAFSTLAKIISEVSFTKDDMGGLVRVKAWYDYTLNESNVNYGNQANGYNNYDPATGTIGARKPLSDAGFEDDLLKYDGIILLDAYIYSNHYIGDNALQIRAGKQVLNWGESLFFQGVNQINPIDVPSFRRPGAELKEVFLPQWIISGSLDLPNGDTVNAFYQLKWQQTPIEAGCGNYWSVAVGNLSSTGGNCASAITLVPGGAGPTGPATGVYVGTHDWEEPSDSGQFGFSYLLRPEEMDVEVGFYAMNIHSRVPTLSLAFSDPSENAQASYGDNLGGLGFNVFWEYPEDLQIYGISLAANPFGLSVSAELNHTVGFPAQLDGNGLLLGGLGQGPLAAEIATKSGGLAPSAIGGVSPNNPNVFHGYTETDKTQFQVNVLKVGHGLLGEDQYVFVAEVAAQTNDLEIDNLNGFQYNRAFIFGPGPHAAYGGDTCGTVNTDVKACRSTDGYVTENAWGYRLKLQLQYNNVLINNLAVYPSIYWAHDVKGYSVDSSMLEDRTALNTGLKFSYMKKYVLDLNYAQFGDNADFDPLRDRDFYSANFSVSF